MLTAFIFLTCEQDYNVHTNFTNLENVCINFTNLENLQLFVILVIQVYKSWKFIDFSLEDLLWIIQLAKKSINHVHFTVIQVY